MANQKHVYTPQEKKSKISINFATYNNRGSLSEILQKMKDIKIDISNVGFPSQFVSDREKATQEFGLQIGQAIQYEWFRKNSNQCRFYSQWKDYMC